jgi:hypothetical protein
MYSGQFFGCLEEGLGMRRLVILLVLVVAGIVILGFYQNWFHLSTSETDGKTNISVTVDREKMEQDKEKAKEKVQELKQKVRDKTNAGTDGSKEKGSQP